jgi:iron-sulfur cluster assembly accessory protein
MSTPITLTDAAAKRILALSPDGAKVLRLVVNGGGCSGFQYDFALTDSPHADDLLVEHAGARLAVDVISLPLLTGSEVDFKDELAASRFAVNNPNATMGCGCGVSFSV